MLTLARQTPHSLSPRPSAGSSLLSESQDNSNCDYNYNYNYDVSCFLEPYIFRFAIYLFLKTTLQLTHSQGNQGLERLSGLPGVTQLVEAELGAKSRAVKHEAQAPTPTNICSPPKPAKAARRHGIGTVAKGQERISWTTLFPWQWYFKHSSQPTPK